ncbi:phosphatidylinositol phosphate kinase [Stylonychia lemnae]|uniref:Phosphatidylinositol phosphate kinase n=1 Tax=Stylonychia lemnae TaxID=5949 RepID=A0A077ZQS6_STYLE|nr:phosphatidylinositol phosphate kinase [Stylonychia lemnae]|eukprot:CDW72257.1 phosphatidylinositol phosphate kinase [Stylonychia lemnae]
MSMTGSVFVASTIFYSKKLQAHPQPLIAYICMCEAISSFSAMMQSVDSKVFASYFGLDEIFSYTVAFNFSPTDLLNPDDTEDHTIYLDKYKTVLCHSNEYFLIYFQLMSLMLNMCLCIDLILTLRNPFYPSKRRVKFYIIFSSIIVSILVVLEKDFIQSKNSRVFYWLLLDNCDDYKGFEQSTLISQQASNLIFAMSLSVYIIVALYSSRPGLNKRVRWFFLRKHWSYVGIFILVWTLNLAQAYYQLFNPKSQDDIAVDSFNKVETPVQTVSQFAAFSTGLWLTIVRLSEPYFYYIVKKKWLEMFGKPPGDCRQSNELYNNTLNSFLTQSLNVELVNIILHGITQFTKKSFEDHLHDREIKDIELEQFSLLRRLELPRIEIDNPDTIKRDNRKKFQKMQDLQQSQNQDEINFTIDQNTTLLEEPKQKIIINESVEIFEHKMIMKAGEGQGKSGSFFFFSDDKKFIIKTMTDSELQTFKLMFKDYYDFLLKNPRSMLARIYGIFTVQMEDIVPVHLILMGNTIQTTNKDKILNIFDLKGSIYNRKVKGKNHKNTDTLKDLNLFKKCQDDVDDRRYLLDVIEDDVKFLAAHKLMDYSLLLCIEKNWEYYEVKQQAEAIVRNRLKNEEIILDEDFKEQVREEKIRLKGGNMIKHHQTYIALIQTFIGNRHKWISKCGKFIYHMAVIDYLQEFNCMKVMESRVKEYILNRDYYEISCVDPLPYQKRQLVLIFNYQFRFFKFMSNHVIIDFHENKKDRQQHSFILRRQLSGSVQHSKRK